jgi:hypothetical protein
LMQMALLLFLSVILISCIMNFLALLYDLFSCLLFFACPSWLTLFFFVQKICLLSALSRD